MDRRASERSEDRGQPGDRKAHHARDPCRCVEEAWPRLRFSDDVSAETLAKLAKDAEALGYLPSSDVTGIIDPEPLRESMR